MQKKLPVFGEWILRLYERWHNPRGKRKIQALILMAFLYFTVTSWVYFSGGIQYSFSHSMYIPIILGGLFFRVRGAVIGGLLAGLLLGPFMPIDVEAGEFQKTFNWLFRTGVFVLVGSLFAVMLKGANYLNDYLKWLADHNQETKMPNENSLRRKIDVLDEGEAEEFFLLLIKVNNYDDIISMLGPDSGRVLFDEIKRRLHRNIFSAFDLFHLKGERLACLIKEEPEKVINKILASMDRSLNVEGIPVYVDLNIGAASFPGDARDSTLLMQKAEIAYSQAIGREKSFEYYKPEMEQQNRDRLRLLGDLPQALEREELFLQFQPQISLKETEVTGMEALLRWYHPQRGFISPGEFIPQAENTGLMYMLTRWVIEEGFKKLIKWREKGYSWQLSLNISARNLEENDFFDFLAQKVDTFGIEKDAVMLEITEAALMKNPGQSISLLQKIRGLGLKIAIDDFGAGHSSLAYLKNIPADCLKIDRSFVMNLPYDRADQDIVNSAIDLSFRMGRDVLAEGVEEESALKFLLESGCNQAQGYFFSPPVDEEILLREVEKIEAMDIMNLVEKE